MLISLQSLKRLRSCLKLKVTILFECVTMWRMLATFGRDYKRILDYLAANGAECIDMPYARYLDMNWELELNIGKLATFFVVDKEVAFL